MPTSFSRLDLPSQESLDHALRSVLDHATTLLRQQLDLDGLAGEQEERVCHRVLEMWIDDARQRLKPNLTIEGILWKEWEAQRQAIAPLDTQLANRLSNLSRTVDELSGDIVIHRRELPQRYAEALKAREEVLDSFSDRLEEQRSKVESESRQQSEFTSPQFSIARADQVSKTLSTALTQAELLAKDFPKLLRTVQEQHELVAQLRSMPP